MNSKQRSKLRALAHHLKPVVLIGKSGITHGAIKSITNALDKHELIKIKFIDDKKIKNDFIEFIERDLSSNLIGNIGHTLILFKYQTDETKRKIDI